MLTAVPQAELKQHIHEKRCQAKADLAAAVLSETMELRDSMITLGGSQGDDRAKAWPTLEKAAPLLGS